MNIETASLPAPPAAAAGQNAETKRLLDDMLSSFETFKQANDARLAEIEKRGTADTLLEEKVDRINARLTHLNSTLQRPALADPSDAAAEDPAEVKAAFSAYIRQGDLPREMKAGSAIADEAVSTLAGDPAAVLVPRYFEQRLTDHISGSSALSRLAKTQIVPVAQNIDFLRQDSEVAASWVGETDDRPTTAAPRLKKLTVPMGELFANPAVTQSFFDDAAIDVEEWLLGSMGRAFADKENQAFMSGTGENQPSGLLSGSTTNMASDGEKIQHVMSNHKTGFKRGGEFEFLSQMMFALNHRYRRNAAWLMDAKVQAHMRKLQDPAGNYIWSLTSTESRQPLLFGYPVYDEPHLPDVVEGNLVVCFGDFERAYMVTRPPQTRLIRDPYSNKPYVQFYATRHVGGMLTDPRALIALKVGT